MKNAVATALMAVILGISIAIYFYWQHSKLKPETVQVKVPSLSLAKPELRQLIETPARSHPLPMLAESDSFMLDALTELVGNKSLMKFFHTEQIIHNIVATIDNLPRRQAFISVIPVEQTSGRFITEGTESDLTISTQNAVRYTPYIKIAEAIDAKKLVELYIRLYPLFQQSYEDMGYPKKYFNDRLVETLNNLLDTPVIKEPIKLEQPMLYYLFVDPDLERRSMGQKILIRIGDQNEAMIKGKLREIEEELRLHTHEKKMEIVE